MKKSKFLTLLAFLGGSVFYKFVLKIVDLILCQIYNMSPLNYIDQFFYHDTDENLANTSMVLSFTKFEFQNMSDHLRKGFKALPLRCKIVEIFGSPYFKKMTEEEFDRIWPEICIEENTIHTQEDL